VPESSQVHRSNGRIFDRNEDGDFDITDNTRLVAELYHRKQATYSENKIYPFAGLKNLRLICRKMSQTRGNLAGGPSLAGMDDMELLKSAQLLDRPGNR
jgi:ATP-dependent DNA helicase RecG